jgi:hypothetical protein
VRYQIHRLQQEALIELGLNTEDALLLDWMLNWKDGSSMERIVVDNNDVAYWVNYSKVVEELPILFKKTKGFASTEEEEKAKKANTTKVARMLKGNLSKVLTRHEKKVQGKTKVYISFNREMIDYLVNNENKKASTDCESVKATNKNKKSNNSIPQNNKKYSSKSKENKILNNKHNNTVNNTFAKYEEKELEKLLLENQERKFKANYPYKEETRYTKDGQRIDIG